MLSESFIAATLTSHKPNSQLPSSLKDVGICLHEIQPQVTLRHGYKKSSANRNCLAISEDHIFTAQAEKAVLNVYSREKGNQEATVPFPERVHSLAYVKGSGILVIGTEGGKLMLWELATGRLTTSTASHLQPVTSLCVTENLNLIISASADSAVHVWSLPGLISFSQPSVSYNVQTSRSPVRTFSGHRSAVTALACGHSRSHTVFALSCSQDLTCYIWDVQDGQILQTYLLPSIPLCFSIDIADRAIFAGYSDGSIQVIDLYDQAQTSVGQKLGNIHNSVNDTAIQLTSKQAWPAAATQADATNCITLSYDGTLLLSGHASGKVISWDVARGRVRSVVIDLDQPVTNITMLTPDGLPTKRPNFAIKAVVKPRMDLSIQTENGTSGVPASYSFQAQIISSHNTHKSRPQSDFEIAMTCPFFPQDIVDEALAELKASAGTSSSTQAPSEKSLSTAEQKEKQIADLNHQLDILRNAIGKSRQRRMARMERREELGQKRREAYLEAGKGKKGDAAMVEWEEKIRDLDRESDEEELGQEVYGDLR